MSGDRRPPTWRELNHRTAEPSWPDPAVAPRRTDLTPGDAEGIADVVRTAAYMERHLGWPLVEALVACCEAQGWPEWHRLSVWTVAGYANLFPLHRGYGGRLVRDRPDRALRYAYEDFFWGDPVLVAVAARRAAIGWTGRECPRDYAERVSRLERAARVRPRWH